MAVKRITQLILAFSASAFALGAGAVTTAFAQTPTTPASTVGNINALILASASIITTIGTLITYLTHHFKTSKKIEDLGKSLSETDAWVAENEAKTIQPLVAAAVGISPEAQAIIDKHAGDLTAATAKITALDGQLKEAKAALDAMKAVPAKTDTPAPTS